VHAGRFVSNIGALLAGGFLAAASFAFGWRTVGWLALACGCAVAMIVLACFAFPHRGSLQRWLDALTLTGAVWTIVASRVFGGPHTIKWLSFADGALVCGLGLVGLIAHELLMERELRALAGSRQGTTAGADRPIGDLRAA
jgi:hypothetical protein